MARFVIARFSKITIWVGNVAVGSPRLCGRSQIENQRANAYLAPASKGPLGVHTPKDQDPTSVMPIPAAFPYMRYPPGDISAEK